MEDYRKAQAARWAQTGAATAAHVPPNSARYEPLSNPWRDPVRPATAGAGAGAGGSAATADVAIQVLDLGYTQVEVTAHEAQSHPFRTTCLRLFCPCCLGDPCGERHVRDLRTAAGTFIALASLVDLGLFAAELALGLASPEGLHWLAPPTCVLIALGAGYAPLLRRGQLWRLVTPIVLHGGPLHLCLNLYMQLTVGMRCETEWGWAATAGTYTVAGVGGCLTSAVLGPAAVSVGASGSLVGLVGARTARLACEWREREPRQRAAQAAEAAVFFVVLASFGSFGASTGGLRIDNSAHGGGLAVGVLLGLVRFGASPAASCCADRLPAACLGPSAHGARCWPALAHASLLQKAAGGALAAYFAVFLALLATIDVGEAQGMSC
jgi:membrane associated rhomboid family serine protease